MKHGIHKILASFPTLREAVDHVNPDLNYNLIEANRYIKEADDASCPCARELGIGGTIKAFVVEDNGKEVIYHVYVMDGLRFFKEFSPFDPVLTNSDLQVISVLEDVGVVTHHGASVPNNKEVRKLLAQSHAMHQHTCILN